MAELLGAVSATSLAKNSIAVGLPAKALPDSTTAAFHSCSLEAARIRDKALVKCSIKSCWPRAISPSTERRSLLNSSSRLGAVTSDSIFAPIAADRHNHRLVDL